MLRKLFFLVALVALMAPLTLAQTSEEGTALVWKFKKGETLKYKDTTNMQVAVNMPMGNRNISMAMVMQRQMTVIDVDNQGMATLKVKFTRVKMNMSGGPGVNVQFDSDKPSDMERAKSDPRLSQFVGMLKKEFTVKIDRTGKIHSTKGMEGTGSGMAQGMGGKESLQSSILEFPMGPIAVGTSWTKSTMQNQGGVPLKLKTSYTFKGVEQKDGKSCAKIDFKIKFDMDISKNPIMARLNPKITKSEGTGGAFFAINEGRLISSKTKGTIAMSMSGNMGGQNFNMSQNIKLSMSTELVK